MTMAAASNITIDEITSRRDALFNRFTKSSVTVFSVVNVDVTVLVAVVVISLCLHNIEEKMLKAI